METMNDRLRKARAAAGYETASEAARALGVSVSTYSAHENGQNGFKAKDAARYARMFKVDSAWLMMGTPRLSAAQAPNDEPNPHASLAERIAWYWSMLSTEDQELRSVLVALLQTLEKQDAMRPQGSPAKPD